MITVYSRKGCQQCVLAKEWLTRHQIDFKVVDIQNNDQIVKKLIEAGFHQIPVITDGKKAISGFSDSELQDFVS